VFTPKHGSWLNLIEGFFSKIARSMLRHIRVASKDELKNRILAYLDELNREPVVHTWSYRIRTAVVLESILGNGVLAHSHGFWSSQMRCLLPLAGLSLFVAGGLTAGIGLISFGMLGGAACCCRPRRRDRPEYV
jgi:hypothetical protein